MRAFLNNMREKHKLKSKKEKFFINFYPKVTFMKQVMGIGIVSFLLTSLLALNNTKTPDLSELSFFIFSLLFLLQGIVVAITDFVCSELSEHYTKKHYNKIYTYLKNNFNEPEIKENLLKLSLINQNRLPAQTLLNSESLAHHLDNLNKQNIPLNFFTEMTDLITHPNFCEQYLKNNENLINKTNDELELMFKKHIANILSEDEKLQKTKKEIIQNYSDDNKDAVFQKQKKLTMNL